jgi:ATP:cob(I)alamin adenosyltransferase
MSVEGAESARTAPAGKPARGSGHVYTRFGDAGQTRLLGRAVVSKDHPRVMVYGTLDEATSALGLARATTRYDDLLELILALQGELMQVMSLLATPPGLDPPVPPLALAQIQRLEKQIDCFEAEILATGFFVRPGGSQASAALHLARTIVRRAEREMVGLSRGESVDPLLLQYLNRLSDLLYVMARVDEQREIRRLVLSALESGTPAQAGGVLDLARCDKMIEAGIRRAREIGVPMVLTVVDSGGNLLELRRMDNALLVSTSLAPRKAYTAAALRMPTSKLAELAQPGAPLFGIDVSTPELTLVGGGLPVSSGGAVIGAVGVSGGSVEEDTDVAQAMLAVA